METILFVCSIVTCAIGISTFVAGMVSRAKNDGTLVQKIEQAIKGIEELKTEVKTISGSQQSLALLVNTHGEQIKTLFNMIQGSDMVSQMLSSLTEVIKDRIPEVNDHKE